MQNENRIEVALGDKEWREGFGGTRVQVGDVVRIRKGFGRNATAIVLRLGQSPFGDCEVEIVKAASPWNAGNRVDVMNCWLEGANF